MCTYIVIYVILTVQWERYRHITAPIYLKEGVILPLTESLKKQILNIAKKVLNAFPLMFKRKI